MKFLSRLFSKSTDDYLAKGDALLASMQFYDARTAFEKGLQQHLESTSAAPADDAVAAEFTRRIDRANLGLAELNIREGESALRAGATAKAAEYLELAKSLTLDPVLREKAERLLAGLAENANETSELEVHSHGCSSCSSSHAPLKVDVLGVDHDMAPLDYYDLLIRQLPPEIYSRYAALGENFAYMYLAASRDEHAEALELIERWFEGSDRDIYSYEKGMILHRLGREREAEACLRDALEHDGSNPLPYLGLALVLIEGGRFPEAAQHLDRMISEGTLGGQAVLLRGEVDLLTGETDQAIERLAGLLSTPLAKPAAERLYGALMQCGRQKDATHIFKTYLGGCRH